MTPRAMEDTMNRIVLALCALVVLVLSVACEGKLEMSKSATPTVEAAKADPNALKIIEIEKALADIQRDRDVSVGWVGTVKPGDRRNSSEVAQTLSKLSELDKRLDPLPNSDKTAGLRTAIYRAMVEDCKLLLKQARIRQDLLALETFMRYARGLDTTEKDFEVEPSELRKEALAMAKKHIAQSRAEEWEGHEQTIRQIVAEWHFTPQELGLTAEETKSLER